MRLPGANDTRLLVAGIAALLALVAYLVVAFVDTHGSVAAVNKLAPWTPSASTLVPIPLRQKGEYAVRVTPVARGSNKARSYGALVQTLVPNPKAGRKYVVALWLRGSVPGRIGVELNEFLPGVARYPLQTTVPATAGWHHYTFGLRVKGQWLGLAMYVYRVGAPRTWFAVRGLTVALGRR